MLVFVTKLGAIHQLGLQRHLASKGAPKATQGIPRESQKGLKEIHASPKGSQETPRQFATKTGKLAEAFDEK